MGSRKNCYVVINLFFWSFFCGLPLIGILPKTPLMIADDLKRGISFVYPNRWSFFTKDPTEAYIYILQKSPTGYTLHPSFPNCSVENLFGLVNNARAVSMEYGLISSLIDSDLWNSNNGGANVLDVLERTEFKTLKIKKNAGITALEGALAFVKIEPLPYLWRQNFDQFKMPGLFVKITVE